MDFRATTDAPLTTGADTIAVGLFDDEGIPHDLAGEPLGALVASGEAKPGLGKLAHVHAEGVRWVIVGLGVRDAFTREAARVAAAAVVHRALELGTKTLCWELPHGVSDAHATALVEGTGLAAYAPTAFRPSTAKPPTLRLLVVASHDDVSAPVARGAAAALAANAARDLQRTPANHMTPSHLVERAQAIEGVTVEVERRAGIERLGMGLFAAVAQGSTQEPALITLRYAHPDAKGPTLGFVGKAVTFDAGGISIKPANKMSDMKYDMSGGAAVLAATEAIAAAQLEVNLVAVIGATENLLDGGAMKPGDVVTARNGLTVEILNTDAEGRMVLADCLTHAVEQGAERLVDVATLTGAIISALGDTHAGLIGDDDAWCAAVTAAGEATGELVWRLPLHADYAKLIETPCADLANANENRKAGSITAAQFLARFTGDVPWAHLDIAGTAWDNGRAYTAKGGSGYATRLLLELAREQANT